MRCSSNRVDSSDLAMITSPEYEECNEYEPSPPPSSTFPPPAVEPAQPRRTRRRHESEPRQTHTMPRRVASLRSDLPNSASAQASPARLANTASQPNARVCELIPVPSSNQPNPPPLPSCDHPRELIVDRDRNRTQDAFCPIEGGKWLVILAWQRLVRGQVE